jgi:hypothetical protein
MRGQAFYCHASQSTKRFDATRSGNRSCILDATFADRASFESNRADSLAAQHALRRTLVDMRGYGLQIFRFHVSLLSLVEQPFTDVAIRFRIQALP